MDFWHILEIPADSTEKEVKKAYRSLIKQNHPEEAPEKFKRIRDAYERAIEYLRGSSEQQNIEAQAEPLSTSLANENGLIEKLDTILSNPTQRFNADCLNDWVKKAQKLSIAEFETLSKKVVALVLENRWLAGETVKQLFTCFDWSMLLNGNEDDTNLGYFLQGWSNQVTPFPLSQLGELSAAEQRAIMSFVRPMQSAMEQGYPDALVYLFSQPNHLNLLFNKPLIMAFIKAFQAGVRFEASTMTTFIDWVLCSEEKKLSVEQLLLIGSACLRLNENEQLERVLSRLYEESAFAELCELRYQTLKSDHLDRALLYAFIRQQLYPVQEAYWYSELRAPLLTQESEHPRGRQWLINTLHDSRDPIYQSYMELQGLNGIYGELIKACWLGLHGSWAQLLSQRDKLESLECDTKDKELIALILHWLDSCLTSKPANEPLLQKLMAYGSDKWFEQPPLEKEELESLAAEEWLKLISRHPLLPDSWFSQLKENELFQEEDLSKLKTFDYIQRLYYYRFYANEYSITVPWQDVVFNGLFDWAQTFYSFATDVYTEKNGLDNYLKPLPESLKDSCLAAILTFISDSNDYSEKSIDSLDNYEDNFVFQYIVYSKVIYIREKHSVAEICDLAREGDHCAYFALAEILTEDNIDEAIVFWNLGASYGMNYSYYRIAIQWVREALSDRLTELELDFEQFSYTEPEFLRALLTTDKEWLKKPDYFYDIEPVEQARTFHFPMGVLISNLYADWNTSGYDLTQLKMLVHRRKAQSELQNMTTDIAVLELERKYQHRLETELSQGVAEIKSDKMKCVLLFLSILLSFPIAYVFYDYLKIEAPIAVGVVLFIVSEILFGVYISKGILPCNRKSTFGYIYGTLGAVVIFRNPIFFIVHIIGLAISLGRLSPLYINGGWSRKIFKKKRVNLRKILGFATKG